MTEAAAPVKYCPYCGEHINHYPSCKEPVVDTEYTTRWPDRPSPLPNPSYPPFGVNPPAWRAYCREVAKVRKSIVELEKEAKEAELAACTEWPRKELEPKPERCDVIDRWIDEVITEAVLKKEIKERVSFKAGEATLNQRVECLEDEVAKLKKG